MDAYARGRVVLRGAVAAAGVVVLAGSLCVVPAHAAPALGADGAGIKVCFSHLHDDTGMGVPSQNYEAAFDAYDIELAGDLRVKKRSCRARELRVAGTYFGGTGPADSLTITFFSDASGRPGEPISSQTLAGQDTFGSFELRLSRVDLKARATYWVSVVANMDFEVRGQWGWVMSNDQFRNPPMWRNPGDGFETGCTDWGELADCTGYEEYSGLDPMFEVRGKRRG